MIPINFAQPMSWEPHPLSLGGPPASDTHRETNPVVFTSDGWSESHWAAELIWRLVDRCLIMNVGLKNSKGIVKSFDLSRQNI